MKITHRSNDISLAADALMGGELVAIPTETVYGLAGNGFNSSAVQAIFKTKNRPFYDPLILHTDSVAKIKAWGLSIPEQLLPLIERYWPGPLTVLLDRNEQISDFITAGLLRVAFRIPDHPLTLELLSSLNFPLAAPSANPFGFVSPTKPEHVLEHFEGKIAMVLDGGPCVIGIESTIVGVENGDIVVYRLGGLTIEKIEALVGKVRFQISSSKPSAPGMLLRHYAPNKRLVAIDNADELKTVANSYPNPGLLIFNIEDEFTHEFKTIRLSKNKLAEEAAQAFYDALRSFNADANIETIVVERLPDFDLGRAINDRLNRAVNNP